METGAPEEGCYIHTWTGMEKRRSRTRRGCSFLDGTLGICLDLGFLDKAFRCRDSYLHGSSRRLKHRGGSSFFDI